MDDANRIIQRLKERFPWIEGPPKEDICYATQNRQEAVRILASQANVVLVLGSQNSSNSQRLRELGGESGRKAYLVDGPQDLHREWFSPNDCVLITAGASAPESVVQSTIEWLQAEFQASMREETIRKEEVHFRYQKHCERLPRIRLVPCDRVGARTKVTLASSREEPIGFWQE